MNIFITKIQHTPNIYQQTYSTYETLGSSDRDMQRGTTLVFGLNILNLKGLLGKGPRYKRTHTFLTSKPWIAAQNLLQTHVQHKKFNTPLDGTLSLCLRDWLTFVFLIFVWVLQVWRFLINYLLLNVIWQTKMLMGRENDRERWGYRRERVRAFLGLELLFKT